MRQWTRCFSNFNRSIHPVKPAVTRFAPSPTGFLHLGSLRTALYNYLLAKNTGGTFILRLEDTDRTRLVEGAEKNIYDSLKWCGITIDEGPMQGGPNGPYRQSDRKSIYKKYAEKLVENGDAYYCYCSKNRLKYLRDSAMRLKPPTTVTYDRHCLHHHGEPHEGGEPVIRFKSPDKYDPIEDLVHGKLNLQPQYNANDRRFDDIVIMKSDGLPTYHFANVVDDHLMGVTHVIRGEEWLSATPKHVALYKAFNWEPPSFIHIPLLTSLKDKKLSKRDGSMDILSLKEKFLPEALVNFVSLFGWSPSREDGISVSEVMTMNELIEKFSLDNLTRGNAKVNESKLYFFNKQHLLNIIKSGDSKRLFQIVENFKDLTSDTDQLVEFFKKIGPNLNTLDEIYNHKYLFEQGDIEYNLQKVPEHTKQILQEFIDHKYDLAQTIEALDLKRKNIFQSVRFALSNGVPGLSIPELTDVLGEEVVRRRINSCIKSL